MRKERRYDQSFNLHKKPYVKINSYSSSWSFSQILTIILFVIELTLHSIFVAQPISKQDSPILWIMLAVTYATFAIIVRDYLYLTCGDPVDDLILGIKRRYRDSQTRRCRQGCDNIVHKSSYHCHTCQRCVENFDHHCKYLNNCIGGKNYQNFFRMLVMVTTFCVFIIGSAIWIFVIAQNDDSFNDRIVSKWGVIATLIYTIVMLIAVDSLLCFHCYLIFFLKKTTLQYLQERTEDNGDSSKQNVARGNIQ